MGVKNRPIPVAKAKNTPSGGGARLDPAAVKAFIAFVKEALNPASLQLVLGVVLFAAIEGYAQAQGNKASAEEKSKATERAEETALKALNDAIRDGVISEAERTQLQDLLARDFDDAQFPNELRWLVAEIANAPVTDGPILLDQVRVKVAKWFAQNSQSASKAASAKSEGAQELAGGSGSAEAQIFKAIGAAATEFEQGGFGTQPALQREANLINPDSGSSGASFELTGVQFGNAVPGGSLLDIKQFSSFAQLLGPNAANQVLAEASDFNMAYLSPVGGLAGAGGGGGGGGAFSIASSGGGGGSFGGAVIDGYVENTLVFIDADGDYVWDTNEFWAITNSSEPSQMQH